MSVDNFKPTIWSARLELAYRKQFVFRGLVNQDWQGEITGSGGSVKITTTNAISVGDTASTITYETPTSTQQSLVIDQDKTWGFEVGDLDEVQANVPLIDRYMVEAGISLADTVDQNLAALYTASGLDDISLDVGTDDFYEKATIAAQQLDEANVPSEGRWMVVTPRGHRDLLNNTAFIHATAGGDQVIARGMVGEVAGFTVYKSNNLVNTTASTYAYMYGINSAITLAQQLVKTEALRDKDTWMDYVRGRLVFGRKVVRPSALGTILADQT